MFQSHNCGSINTVLAVFWLNCLQYNYLQWNIDCIGFRIWEYILIYLYIFIIFYLFIFKVIYVCLAFTMFFFSFVLQPEKHTSIKTETAVINHTLLYYFCHSASRLLATHLVAGGWKSMLAEHKQFENQQSTIRIHPNPFKGRRFWGRVMIPLELLVYSCWTITMDFHACFYWNVKKITFWMVHFAFALNFNIFFSTVQLQYITKNPYFIIFKRKLRYSESRIERLT